MPTKVPRAGATLMTKSRTNSHAVEVAEIIQATEIETSFIQQMEAMEADQAASVELPKKVMTMQEKIELIENLELLIEKRAKLVQTRSELERFRVSSNDFNCSMRLNDSDGNVFTTSFTAGVKKVIEFLKTAFDASILEVENEINF